MEYISDLLVEIKEYCGEGYKPLIDFNGWRVAVLNFIDDVLPDRMIQMERHTRTDEVFILVEGRGTLLLGGADMQVQQIEALPMELNKLYNVKRNCWHNILLSRDAKILLVENSNTGATNSGYWRLTEDQRRVIRDIAKQQAFSN
jgi:hypothetical protein